MSKISMEKNQKDEMISDKEELLFIDVASGIQVTHTMFQYAIDNLKYLLDAKKIEEESTITLICEHRINQVIYLTCGLHLNYTINVLNPDYNDKEIDVILEHSNPAIIFTDLSTLNLQRNIPTEEVALNDLFKPSIEKGYHTSLQGNLLIYTSGTTGKPKGVLLTAKNMSYNVHFAIKAFDHSSSSITASILPLFHTFTLMSDVLPIIFQKGCIIICPTFNMQSALAIQVAITKWQVTSLSAVPLIFKAIHALFKKENLSSLKFVISGAAPLSEKTRLNFFDKFDKPIIPCYGLSESTCFATISPVNQILPKSAGKPAGISVEIVDIENSHIVLAPSIVGEIVMKGESVIDTGYHKSDLQQNFYTESGYFKTGDIGYIDEEGYLFITGRKKNMIIRGGKKVYLEDVDFSLAAIGFIEECVSIGSTNPSLEDKSITFVRLKEEPDNWKSIIKNHIKEDLSIIHVPDYILQLEDIPRTKTQKPKISKLLEIFSHHDH